MKRLSKPTVLKSTCNRSSNYLYELQIESQKEAQSIANDIHKIVGLHRPPVINFSKRMTKRLLGNCRADGRIKLFPPKGQQIGTLLHELCHLYPAAVADKKAHGFAFKRGLMVIRHAWDQVKNKYLPADLEANWSPENCEGLKEGFEFKTKVVPVETLMPKLEAPKVSEPSWFDMGANAHAKGLKRVPVNDGVLMSALAEMNKRVMNWSNNVPLTLWLKGWDSENVKPEPKPEPNVRKYVTKSGFTTTVWSAS